MNMKILKWALPAFALTALVSNVEAKLPGKTSYGARLGFNNFSLNGKGIAGGATFIGAAAGAKFIQDFSSNHGGSEGDLFISRDADLCRNWSLGVEAFIGGHKTSTGRAEHVIEDGASKAFTNVSQHYTVGGKIKLGRHLTHDALLYVSLGVQGTGFEVNNSHYVGAAGALYGVDPEVQGTNKNHLLWAWLPGIGVKWKLKGNWCAHIDATYAMYEGFSKEVSGGNDTSTTYNYTLNMQPTTFGLTFGFSRPL